MLVDPSIVIRRSSPRVTTTTVDPCFDDRVERVVQRAHKAAIRMLAPARRGHLTRARRLADRQSEHLVDDLEKPLTTRVAAHAARRRARARHPPSAATPLRR